jgi:hypothetical protein
MRNTKSKSKENERSGGKLVIEGCATPDQETKALLPVAKILVKKHNTFERHVKHVKVVVNDKKYLLVEEKKYWRNEAYYDSLKEN